MTTTTITTTTMLYVTENKRKTLAGLLAAVLTLAIGVGIGRLTDSSSPELTPQLAAARQPVVHQHAASVAAGGALLRAQRTIAQLRFTVASQSSMIARQHAQIRTLNPQRRQDAAHRRKRRQ